MTLQHRTVQPKILYYGTPVVLLSTCNEDGTTNISPISSSWALGSCLVLGLGCGGKGLENLKRYPECVINLPDPSLWRHVERLALLTGKTPVPSSKKELGFRYEKDKFSAAKLTPCESEKVRPARIAECPLQIEASVQDIRIPENHPWFAVVETETRRVHAREAYILGDHYIDPNQWRPLIYNFRHYFSLGEELGKTARAET
ncbi:hypothetical protein CHM34_12000 [Paludifilum halophilum]|uniref:Flavin reductase like domain-containing protein n=2 Tax=Paludifilum halophilum TaxID=1642702 RepID=A0A235B5X0_9BACL|nr:hypothetical protein CHM34_12000 [Paludifilum halophilum]